MYPRPYTQVAWLSTSRMLVDGVATVFLPDGTRGMVQRLVSGRWRWVLDSAVSDQTFDGNADAFHDLELRLAARKIQLRCRG